MLPLPPRFLRSCLPLLCLTAQFAQAGWQEDIGYNRLKTELGASLPTGSGVSIAQTEPAVGANNEYVPTTLANPLTGNYAGKTFSFRSGAGNDSWHAIIVADYYYGVNTNPLLGAASLAPNAGQSPSTIRAYEANGWIGDDLLRIAASGKPLTESASVSNHSWIAEVPANLTAEDANEILQRFDYTIVRDDYVAVAGLNNGSVTVVPHLMASSYNALTVGLTNGQHSSGTTPIEVDGGGRIKPDIVAPQTATSWAAATVSSAVALLTQKAATMPSNARRCETLRAIVLAGARKNPFPNWANSPTLPLDAHYGAGEINVWRSYHILNGAEANPSGSSFVPLKAWDYNSSLAANITATYFFTIPANCTAAEVSLALTWDRNLSGVGVINWGSPTSLLANLDLELLNATGFSVGSLVAESKSGAALTVPHNIEHIWVKNLPAGNYAIRVRNAATPSISQDYSLAWLIRPVPAQPTLNVALNAGSLSILCTNLCANVPYELQSSTDLTSPWLTTDTFSPSGSSQSFLKPTSPQRIFYRLKWSTEE